MNSQRVLRPLKRHLSLVLGVLLLASAGLGISSARAEEKKADQKSAGKLTSADGTAFARAKPGTPWQVLKEGDPVPAGQLVLGLPGSSISSANGAVQLAFFADLDESSPFPIKEAAVVLNSSSKADLDLTLDRGRVDVINRRDTGSAHVHCRFHRQELDLELQEPGTRVVVELYGRWAAGTHFSPKAKSTSEPHATLVVLVLQGKAGVKAGTHACNLQAPPGKALVQWDSITGCDETPSQMDKLPTWATPEALASPLVKGKQQRLEQLREMILKTSIPEALTAALNSEDAGLRRVGVIACGAFDELALLGDTLNNAKQADVWDNAVVTLRHWLGRGAGQDAILYKTLIERRKLTPAQAETIVNLLHSFGDAEISRPELYETLIEYLRHKVLGIRALANWHLYRLVPAGRRIAYNPNGTPEEREQAYEAWKKLVPSGQLPQKTKSSEKN